MKVAPAASATFSPLPANPFSSDPPEALEGKFGGTATCTGGFGPIQLGATLLECEANPKFVVTTNGRPRRALLPGIVMLPDTVLSTLFSNPGCPVGFGVSKEFAVRFESSQGANPSFNGLKARENLLFPLDGCNMKPSKLEGTWTLGESPAPSNALIDANTFCATEPITCTTTIKQTFSIGACITSPVTTINFTMTGTTGDVTRDDMGAQ